MADSLQRLDRGHAMDEADPFAELTRIMGHDPRQQSGQEPAGSQDDYEIDLERELMGGFDEAEGQGAYEPAPQQEAVAPQPEEPEAAADPHPYLPPQSEPAGDETLMEAEMAAIFEGELLQDEPGEEIGDEPAAAVQWAAAEEVGGEGDAPVSHEIYSGPASSEPAQAYPEPEQYAGPERHLEPEGGWEAPPAETLRDDSYIQPEDSGSGQDAAYDFGYSVEAGPGVSDALPEDDAFSARSALADVDMDFGELVLDEPDTVQPDAAPVAEPAELSLEDELGLILSQDDAAAGGEARSFEGPEQAYASDADAAYAPDPYEPDAHAHEHHTGAPDAEATGGAAFDDGRFELRYEGHEYEHAGSVPSEPDPFGVADDPEPVRPVAAQDDGLPDLDLVEVPETAIAVADDLDLPDFDFQEDELPSSAFDELENDFAEILRPVEEAQPSFQEPPAEEGMSDEDRYFAEALGGAAGLTYAAAQPAYEPDPQDVATLPDYDAPPAREAAFPAAGRPDNEYRNRMLMAGAAVLAVALVGGGAYAFWPGGGGGGGDTPALVRAGDEPLKVRPENPGGATVPNQDSQAHARATEGTPADAPGQERLVRSAEEPIDVAARTREGLPGVTIGQNLPNLEALTEDGAAKIEERLAAEDAPVAAAEDVIAVTPRRVRTLVVRPDGTMVPRERAAPESSGVESSGIQAGEMQASSGVASAAGESAAIPEPAAREPTTGEQGPAAQAPLATSAGPVAEAAESVSGETPVAQPAPEPRVTPEPQVAALPPAGTAPAASPATPPVEAAPSGEWSVQIASQPSPESAQATYQDLARRHSSLLSGRGVNIVRADIPGRGIYYRVRIPAASRSEAVTLCESYQAAGGSCFVSR